MIAICEIEMIAAALYTAYEAGLQEDDWGGLEETIDEKLEEFWSEASDGKKAFFFALASNLVESIDSEDSTEEYNES